MTDTPPITPAIVRQARPRVLIALVVGFGVLLTALLIVVIVLLLPRSSNTSACNAYAKTYNHVADAVRLKLEPDIIRSFVQDAPGEFVTAVKDAHGEVAVVMSESAVLSINWASGTNDDGVAFFLSASRVADACKSDGAAITLNELK